MRMPTYLMRKRNINGHGTRDMEAVNLRVPHSPVFPFFKLLRPPFPLAPRIERYAVKHLHAVQEPVPLPNGAIFHLLILVYKNKPNSGIFHFLVPVCIVK